MREAMMSRPSAQRLCGWTGNRDCAPVGYAAAGLWGLGRDPGAACPVRRRGSGAVHMDGGPLCRIVQKCALTGFFCTFLCNCTPQIRRILARHRHRNCSRDRWGGFSISRGGQRDAADPRLDAAQRAGNDAPTGACERPVRCGRPPADPAGDDGDSRAGGFDGRCSVDCTHPPTALRDVR